PNPKYKGRDSIVSLEGAPSHRNCICYLVAFKLLVGRDKNIFMLRWPNSLKFGNRQIVLAIWIVWNQADEPFYLLILPEVLYGAGNIYGPDGIIKKMKERRSRSCRNKRKPKSQDGKQKTFLPQLSGGGFFRTHKSV